MSDEILIEYGLHIAKGYLRFLENYEPYEVEMSSEAYAKARINNDMRTIIATAIEAAEQSGE